MQLITQKLETRFAEVGEQLHTKDPLVICKLFTPDSSWSWFVTEYYPDSGVCYGYVIGDCPEWGYFSLEELEKVIGPYGLKIERDVRFTETFFSNLKLPVCV